MKKGKFIVLEGIDKSGKGTQAKNITNYLFDIDKRNSPWLTREPTRDEDSRAGRRLKELLESGSEVYATKDEMIGLFIEDRANHQVPILYHLQNGFPVICDRYRDSTTAYQAAQGANLDDLIRRQEHFITPDLIILLDIDPKIAMMRKDTELHKDIFDGEVEFQLKVARNYKEIFMKRVTIENIVLINAARNEEKVFLDIKTRIDALYGIKE